MKRKLTYQEPRSAGAKLVYGEDAPEVHGLASTYMAQGMTRQRAYSKARRKLKTPFKTQPFGIVSGGGVNPK